MRAGTSVRIQCRMMRRRSPMTPLGDLKLVVATEAYVSIRQHTSAYVSIRQHTSAYVSMRVLLVAEEYTHADVC
jgi:hypothetical protein